MISILQKALVIISELPVLFRHESSILKAIIGLDLIQGEEKFGASFQFVPTSFMVIVSNTVWALRSVTGFARKFLYFKLDFIPKVCRGGALPHPSSSFILQYQKKGLGCFGPNHELKKIFKCEV